MRRVGWPDCTRLAHAWRDGTGFACFAGLLGPAHLWRLDASGVSFSSRFSGFRSRLTTPCPGANQRARVRAGVPPCETPCWHTSAGPVWRADRSAWHLSRGPHLSVDVVQAKDHPARTWVTGVPAMEDRVLAVTSRVRRSPDPAYAQEARVALRLNQAPRPSPEASRHAEPSHLNRAPVPAL
jgi:hypothetical protein